MRYLGRRLLLLVPVVLGVVTIAFFMLHVTPGDPARSYLGPKASASAIATLRHAWGLDQPLGTQYLHFLGGAATGHLGTSQYFGGSIASLLATRLPVTLALMFLGAALATAIAVPLAAFTASRRTRAGTALVRLVNAVLQGTPTFFLGSILILIFGVRLRLFPAGGYPSDLPGRAVALVLPALAIAFGIVPLLVRSLHASLEEALESDYVAFGRSKGLGATRVYLAYVLRNSSIPGVSILGIQVGALAGGSLVVEQVFALPGMGSMLMTGILNRDYPVVQGCTLAFAVIVVLVYLATDLAYAALDPRIRLA